MPAPTPDTIDFGAFDALTFDCYGTLIDWETGLLEALRPILDAHNAELEADDLLEAYGRHEAEVEAGTYLPYVEVLARSLEGIAGELGFEPTPREVAAFSHSVGDWPAFPDTREALARLSHRFRLGVITNCDDDLFALSNRRLRIEFDWVVTAQQIGAYKPNLEVFRRAFERIDVPRERTLHVAQSLFHDHVPAKELGMTTVWTNRRGDRSGPGATPAATVAPDLTVPDLAAFAELSG